MLRDLRRARRAAGRRAGADLPQPDPARPRAGLVVGRDRGRNPAGPGPCSSTARAGLDDAAVLRLAAEIEGHPDNVAPACSAGSRSPGPEQRRRPGGAAASPRPASARWSSSRRPRADRAGPGGAAGDRAPRRRRIQRRPGGPAGARADRRPALLFEATEDRLHQDYRAPGMPETAALVAGCARRAWPLGQRGGPERAGAASRPARRAGGSRMDGVPGHCRCPSTGARILIVQTRRGRPCCRRSSS